MPPLNPTSPPFLRGPLARFGAACVEPFYGGAMALRAAAFERGWIRRHRAALPVISVGNLTTGGTGKTPTVVYVAHTLESYGSHPAVVLRGYRRDASGRSDEEELLRELLPGVPVVAQPDRAAAVERISREHPSVDVVVLDDGFQHLKLMRDLDLVLIDATNPFGFDRILPRGLMRERPTALRRADAVIVTRADHLEAEDLADLDRRIAELHGRSPVAHTAHTWSQVLDERDQPISPSRAVVFVLAGIGNPQAFLQQATQRFTVADGKLLSDHAHYDRHTLEQLRRELEGARIDAVLTTEKDWVKLRPLIQSSPLPIPVWRPRVSIAFLDGEKEFVRMLLGAASRGRGG